jgi:hypothetical protein
MNVVDPAFGSAHMQSAAVQFNLVPPQAAHLRGAQPMPVGQQDHGGVAVPIAGPLAGGVLEPFNLLFGQIFPRTKFRIVADSSAAVENSRALDVNLDALRYCAWMSEVTDKIFKSRGFGRGRRVSITRDGGEASQSVIHLSKNLSIPKLLLLMPLDS